MLAKFSVKNFRGFKDRITWALDRPNSYEFNSSAIADGIVRNGIIYGPNGCGKTNFGMAVFDIVNHLTQKIKRPDCYSNYTYAGKKKSPVEFSYTFRFGTDTVRYEYSKSFSGMLLEEALYVNEQCMFQKSDGKLVINDPAFRVEDSVLSDIAKSSNNISVINFLASSYPLPEGHYILKLKNFVDSMLWYQCLDERSFIGFESHVENIEEYIIRKNLHVDFQKFLYDVSGQKFDLAVPSHGDKSIFCIIDGSRIPFVQIASTGTKSLELLYYWYRKLSGAKLIFIDEFDAFYHFDLSYNVCRKLFDMGVQVFLTSHNTYLMTNDLLRPDCNFLLNKNVIKSFSECSDKELRCGLNIEKMYRGGAFVI